MEYNKTTFGLFKRLPVFGLTFQDFLKAGSFTYRDTGYKNETKIKLGLTNKDLHEEAVSIVKFYYQVRPACELQSNVWLQAIQSIKNILFQVTN